MQFYAIIVSLALAASASAQVYFQQPIAYQMAAAHQHDGMDVHPHRAVEINAAHESLLHPDLVKSAKFFNNPRAAAALMKDSWFGDKEMQVIDREAEKIPRDQIYKLVKNAGYVARRR